VRLPEYREAVGTGFLPLQTPNIVQVVAILIEMIIFIDKRINLELLFLFAGPGSSFPS
jgi:hypothetical protein